MRQVIRGDKQVLDYTWIKRPSMLRYHPKSQLYTFYPADHFTTTDCFSGITVVYQHSRDRGCFEVTHVGTKGPTVFPAYKKFYIDYTPWLVRDPGAVDVVAICLDENYQTLYILLRQQMENSEHIELWLARVDINAATIMYSLEPPGVPLFSFFFPKPTGPAMLTTLNDRLSFLTEKGIDCNIAAVKELDKLYNLVMVGGKLLITIPTIFDGPHDLDDTISWVNRSNPCIVQILMMLDSDIGNLEGTGIIGAVPMYSEISHSPTPDNWPERPLKVAMHNIDDCIVWTLSDLFTFPVEWYEEHCQYWYRNSVGGLPTYADDAKRQAFPFATNLADCWANAQFPDRFWQLHRREAVLTSKFIGDILKGKAIPMKPILYDTYNQFYIQHPPAFDLEHRSEIDRLGRDLLMRWRQGFVSYNICYHNFHRKIIRQVSEGAVPIYYVTDHEVGDFVYDSAGYYLSLDGNTRYYHIFGLENLSSHTTMVNVRLTAPAGSSLRFGVMSGAPAVPSMTSISWPEIAPHTEVLFTAYATEDIDNQQSGAGLEYGLEIR